MREILARKVDVLWSSIVAIGPLGRGIRVSTMGDLPNMSSNDEATFFPFVMFFHILPLVQGL